MRVLTFGWEFPPYQTGGLATACHGLVTGLLRAGAQVTFVVPFPIEHTGLAGLRLLSPSTGAGVLRVHRVSSSLIPYTTSPWDGLSRRGRAVYSWNLFEEVERYGRIAGAFAASEEHDLIDAHDWMTYEAGWQAHRISGKPLVVHIHSTEFDRSGEWANPEICRREWEGMTKAALVIANSHYLKSQVVHFYRIPEDKIRVVHWGIEEDRPEYHVERARPFEPPTPVVLFLGRVTRQKGPDYFMEMAGKVAGLVPEARFVVAGSGDMLPSVIERSVDIGLAHRVHFTGPLQGSDVFRMLRMATVCVMPSVSEPFGLVALESLKCGTPCLVPRESGVGEVLSHVFKADFWDIDEMTNKIVGLLRHPELHSEMRERGLEEVASARLGLDEPAWKTLAVYREALRESR